MIVARAVAPPNGTLPVETVENTLLSGLNNKFNDQQVLVLIPDHTRSIPLAMLFRTVVTLLNKSKRIDFMVALGTHPPLSENELYRLVGIDQCKPGSVYHQVGLYNHNWSDPNGLVTIGNISREEVIQLAGDLWHPSLGNDVPVKINKNVLEYDHIIILGPTFPHEIMGFSGGAKYLFPGISGPEMIHNTHWLGALSSNTRTIGKQDTPVRAMIHKAAAMMPIAVTLVALVVDGLDLAGIFIGDIVDAWREAAILSAERHIRWFERPFQQVLSCPSPRYDELWTAAKAMYKLEPVVRKGGEIIIFAPYLESVSRVHGDYIFKAGYHTMPYILENWHVFKHIPLGVLAHLTHLRGNGTMENGVEVPDIHITLSSKISEADCTCLNLGYLDPGSVNPANFTNREEEGILHVPNAGEILYRLRTSPPPKQ